MKKYFFMALAALATLTACQQSESEIYVEDGSIKFVNLATRTAVTTAVSLQGGFKVLGYAGTTNIFSNEVADYHDADVDFWQTTAKEYWADNTTYNFFAVYPSSHTLTGGNNQASASVSYENTGLEDLVLAGRQVVTTTGDNGTGRGAAQLVFKHALSRVRFEFTNAYTTETDVKVDITNLQLVNVAKTGTVVITSTNNAENATNSTSVITWSEIEETGTLDINYMQNNENPYVFSNTGITKDNTAKTDYKYVIPQSNQQYNLIGTIRVYDSSATIRTWEFTEASPLTIKLTADNDKLTHIAGESYVYKMNITSDLSEITFTVAVEEWAGDTEHTVIF